MIPEFIKQVGTMTFRDGMPLIVGVTHRRNARVVRRRKMQIYLVFVENETICFEEEVPEEVDRGIRNYNVSVCVINVILGSADSH